MNRRGFLVGAAGLAVAGCGDATKGQGARTREIARSSVAIDYASYYAPITDVRRLAQARADAVGAALTLSDDAAGTAAQVANLETWTGSRGGFRAIAVAPFNREAVEPIAAAAIERGVAIVSYVAELDARTAAIRVDRERAAEMLAERVPPGPVLLVRPPSAPAVPDPFAPGFAAAEAVLRERLDIVAEVEAQAEADASTLVRDARTVVCWNDATAVGAATAPGVRWAGGLGAPSLSSRAAVAALRDGGPLQCLVAPRLSALVRALVDVPFALARGEQAGDVDIAVAVLTPRSGALDAYASDFRAA